MSAEHDRRADAALVRRCAEVQLPPQTEAPLVSVVVPVRNRARQIVEAVASVRAQTLADWELIVVDDGSTDGTRAVLADLARADRRLRVLSTDSDGGGVSAARNLGIEAARGHYVAFLDSDNTWTPHFLRTTLAVMLERGARVGYAVAELVEDGRRRWRGLDGGTDRRRVLDLLAVSNHIDLNVLVVQRELLVEVDGFDTALRRTVDYDLVWRLAEREVPVHVPTVGVRYDASRESADRITVRERPTWREVVKNARLVDWAAAEAAVPARVPGRVSVLVAASTGWAPAWVTATSALRAAGPDADVEVVIADDAGRRADSALLATLAELDPRIRVFRLPRAAGRPLATNLALATSSGDAVFAVQAGVELWPGWFGAVAAALADPEVAAAAPVVLASDGTVASAGLALADDGELRPLLSGLGLEDAARAGAVVDVPAVDDLAVAVRAADAISVRGTDPLFGVRYQAADLGLRLSTGIDVHRHRVVALTGFDAGRGVADPLAVVADRLRPGAPLALVSGRPDAGVTAAGVVAAVAEEGDAALLVSRWERRLAVPAQRDWPRLFLDRAPIAPGEPPRLRWAIRTALPVRPDRARWGDLHFARALAAALERHGQQVVIDHRPAMDRPVNPDPALVEDVVLVLRGLEPWREASLSAPPAPGEGPLRLLWVISHPEQVPDDELLGYHRAYAASLTWARETSERISSPVLPLLQATDPARFHPDAALPDSGEPVLFVGNSRGEYRAVVRSLVEAGVDLAVYGAMWEPFLPSGVVRAAFVENAAVPALYASAGVVLNDHWADMRASGFLSNRLFDAAACGARVVSDAVEGAEELFGGLVRCYRDDDELVELVRKAPDGFPELDRRRELAVAVAREHSFDARALTLLAAAVELREAGAAEA